MRNKTEKTAKTVLVISSQVIRGAVGNRVNIYVLEQLGFSVWAMPTIIMPWQPRQGVSHKLAVTAADFAAFAADIAASPKAAEIDAVISGYFVAPEQVEIAADLIKNLKQKRPDCLFLCDPIMGNENGPYVLQSVMRAVGEKLVPMADLVKPNRNELEWLCGQQFHDNAAMVATIKTRFNRPFFVSSAFPIRPEAMGNLYYDGKEVWLAEHPAFTTELNGFGDIIASLFLFHYLRGAKAQELVQKTCAAVYACLSWTLQCGADELALASAPFDWAAPPEKVELTRLV
ncbi:MAG: pyridoxal kinase [Candidatus Tokpelaia sp.]|nr:MAG: pyridoxal kinase [Candidatus Tokpelaia sp.]KAA6206170.1 MAG: pyridoxal kinase [Candidatus Tokpelaia sp.]